MKNMRKLRLILIIFLVICNISSAQWTIKHLDENLYNTGNVAFKNDSLGLFMGVGSTALKTTNVGETWKSIQLNIDINISQFQFIGDSSVFAVGDSKLIKSENLGENWNSISIFTGKQLYSLWFFNNDSGIVAGYDEIYRTVNKGSTWDAVWSITQFGYKYGTINQLYFPSPKVGYAIGRGRNQSKDPLFDNFLLKSNDSGITWDTITTFSNSTLSAIYFINNDLGFIGTESGLIYKTFNGGSSWTEIPITDSWNTVKSIQFISEMEGFATGGAEIFITSGGGSGFFISKTIDGGETWASYDTIGIPLNSIYFINDETGFVSGKYELIMKSNGTIDKLPVNYPWNLVVDPNSIAENESALSTIKIYPNPTTGILFVQNLNSSKQIKQINIINTSGQIIRIDNLVSNNDLFKLDLSNLIAGIYLFKIEYLDKTEVMKIIKK